MEESATITCTICCLKEVKQEVQFNGLAPDLKHEFPSEEVLSITENPVACNECKAEIEETHRLYLRNECVKIERDTIKIEDYIPTSKEVNILTTASAISCNKLV